VRRRPIEPDSRETVQQSSDDLRTERGDHPRGDSDIGVTLSEAASGPPSAG